MRDNGRPQLSLFWAVLRCCFNNGAHVEAFADEISMQKEDSDAIAENCGEAASGPKSTHSDDRNGTKLEAKWYTWKKTRDDLFGIDEEPWCESWAYHLIFGDSACSKQEYLWKYLLHGKHFQWGMGVLSIPGDGKRSQRAKQRRRRVETKRASDYNLVAQSFRGGAVEEGPAVHAVEKNHEGVEQDGFASGSSPNDSVCQVSLTPSLSQSPSPFFSFPFLFTILFHLVLIENLVSLLTFPLYFVLINNLVVIFPLPFHMPGKNITF